jgi:hypothetical protein
VSDEQRVSEAQALSTDLFDQLGVVEARLHSSPGEDVVLGQHFVIPRTGVRDHLLHTSE